MVGAQFPCLAVSAGFEFNFEVEKASCTGMPSSRCSGVLRPVWPDNAVIMVGYFFFFSLGITSYGVPHSEKEIMAEIYKNGPVEGAFIVYEDFLMYKSGEHQHRGCREPCSLLQP